MSLIPDIRHDVLAKTIVRARARNIILPTFAQQKDPGLVPAAISARLKKVGLWDLDPANLFRITWKNEPVENGGGFGEGNWIEFPKALTGVDATIIGIVGNWFPTGAHKVGAAYGCRAWIKLTGTGTIGISASANVASITATYLIASVAICSTTFCLSNRFNVPGVSKN